MMVGGEGKKDCRPKGHSQDVVFFLAIFPSPAMASASAASTKTLPLAGDIATDSAAREAFRLRIRGQPMCGIGLTHRTWQVQPNTAMMIQLCKEEKVPAVLIRTSQTDMAHASLEGLLVAGIIHVNAASAVGTNEAQTKLQQLLAAHPYALVQARVWPWDAPQL
jgi:hypothetical protein